jgi:hypothetical protein
MGRGLRLALLMLTAILGSYPVGPPPGADPAGAVSVLTVPCRRPNCGGNGKFKGGYRYRCNRCGRSFYYCGACTPPDYLTRDEASKHEHPMS